MFEIAFSTIIISKDTNLVVVDNYHTPFLADPSLVLPALVNLIYSGDERLQATASDACVAVLKYHSQKAEVICMLLDCLRYFSISFHNCFLISQSFICPSCLYKCLFTLLRLYWVHVIKTYVLL